MTNDTGKSFKAILHQPYPLYSTSERLVQAAIVCLFVYLFLAIFQPFDLNLHNPHKGIIIAGYAFTTLVLLILFFVLLPVILPKLFLENTWNVGKELQWMLFLLVAIGFSLTIYEDLICTRPLSLISLCETIAKTTFVGIFPIAGLVIYNYIRLLKRNQYTAQIINQSLSLPSNTKSSIISIVSENKSEYFQTEVDNILFIAAEGNYVSIYTTDNGAVKNTMLRSTITKVESQLSHFPYLYKCHRSFIVNIHHISSIEGNARGYELSFNEALRTIPVSRNNTAVFNDLMNRKQAH